MDTLIIKFRNGTYHLFDQRAYRPLASFGLLKLAQQALKGSSK